MSKRTSKKAAQAAKTTDWSERLRKALGKRTKGALIDALVELAREDRRILRRLDARFEVAAPPKELVAATRQAMADATAFDERDINRNFRYDYAAYSAVKRNLGRLISLGHLRRARELSLELMKKGSYQVEMSDEGLMTDDIAECLQVVIQALPKCDLPAGEVVAWCAAMPKSDRVKCICDRDLRSLQHQFEGSRS
jgi:sulfur relay (sulfurtransferase) DsrC/TusE family protein